MRRNDGQIVPRARGGGNLIPNSFRSLSGYLKIVSSGASTVATTVRSAASAASAIVERDGYSSHDQVLWAGFDKLESEGGITRQVLLLGYESGFQVWDVEEADNVRDLVSRHDGPVFFLQFQPKPLSSNKEVDKFLDARPLLVVCTDGSVSGSNNFQEVTNHHNGNIISNGHELGNGTGSFVPNVVQFYSLKSQSYEHMLKFRSVVYSVRCSSRVVAVAQAAQIHCFDAATLERDYTILTNPIVTSFNGSGGIGYGPLAVGPRWLAYSGSPVIVPNSGRVSPQHLTLSASFPTSASNGSLVAHYAKVSSKQLAAGIVTLGDMGYKKLSRYCSEFLPDYHNTQQSGSPGSKVNGQLQDGDSIGMVIVRDIVSRCVIAQFRAHTRPISALCFDPSGTLLVTASVQGHNINVYRIMPSFSASSSGSDACASYAHLYKLQRGMTNAVIRDISFSDDSQWIMISSTRGTSHLFALSPSGGTGDSILGVTTKPALRWPPNSTPQTLDQQTLSSHGSPVTLSVASRIKSGNNGWRGTVSSAAAAATGRINSLSGAIASSFHSCKANDFYPDSTSLKPKYHLLVFSPSGCVIQYALRILPGLDSMTGVSGVISNTAYDSIKECDTRLVVEAMQKWNICQKRNRREREDDVDIYGENGNSDGGKIFPEGMENGNEANPAVARGGVTKAKVGPEERHHLHKAELPLHQARAPLWTRSEIYFQSMMMDDVKSEGGDSGGEIEIETILTQMIEARTRDLVPLFDRPQAPKFPPSRVPSLDSNMIRQRSGLSDNGRHSCKSNNGSGGAKTVGSQHNNGTEETEKSKGYYVNTNYSPETETKTPLEFVNNTDSSKTEPQLNFVNTHEDGPKDHNLFGDQGDDELD